MKPIQFSKLLVLALLATVSVSGCKKTPVKVTDMNGPAPLYQPKTEFATAPTTVPATGPITEPGTGIRNRSNPRPVPFDVGPAPAIRDRPDVGTANPLPNPPTAPTDITPTNPPPVVPTSVPTNSEPVAFPGGDTFIGWVEHPEVLKDDSVYFDFDSSAVKAHEKAKVPPVADYLKEHATEKVRIAGNCDERGTEEYNRALGERRALALREELLRLGVDPLRIDTVSYGKDKPVASGHDESAWRQNRRGDFIVLTPPPAP